MSNLMSNYSPLDITFNKGSGCWLTDTSGKKYFDALSGVGVVNLGHCHPKITQSIIEQSQELLHTSNWYRIEHQEELAVRLCKLANMDKVFFSNSVPRLTRRRLRFLDFLLDKKALICQLF